MGLRGQKPPGAGGKVRAARLRAGVEGVGSGPRVRSLPCARQVQERRPRKARGEAAALTSPPGQRSRRGLGASALLALEWRSPSPAHGRADAETLRREGRRKKGPYPAGSRSGARRASPLASGVGSRRTLPGSRAPARRARPSATRKEDRGRGAGRGLRGRGLRREGPGRLGPGRSGG